MVRKKVGGKSVATGHESQIQLVRSRGNVEWVVFTPHSITFYVSLKFEVCTISSENDRVIFG